MPKYVTNYDILYKGISALTLDTTPPIWSSGTLVTSAMLVNYLTGIPATYFLKINGQENKIFYKVPLVRAHEILNNSYQSLENAFKTVLNYSSAKLKIRGIFAAYAYNLREMSSGDDFAEEVIMLVYRENTSTHGFSPVLFK